MPPRNLEARRAYNKSYSEMYKQAHSSELKIKDRQRRLRAKEAALTHYGNGKCACVICGENRLACLSLDHIDGGGAQARREIPAKTGSNIYGYLRCRDYPEGYQTLCMNCQYIKRYTNGECGGGRNYPDN